MTKRKYVVYGVMLIVIVIAIYALSLLIGRQSNALTESNPASVPTAYVESDTVSTSFKLAGRVKELLVDEGDAVKKGQLLAVLDSAELQDKVAQAQAALKTAQANVSQAQAGVVQAQAGIAQAQAGVTQAQAAEQAAQVKVSQGTTAVQVTTESSASQIEQAEAAVAAAKAKWQAVKSGARPEEIAQAKTATASARDALTTATKNLNRTEQLYTAGLATDAALDQAKLQQQQAQAQVDAATEKQKLVEKGSRQEEIDAAYAQYQQAQAALKEAQAGQGQVSLRQEDVKAAQAAVNQAQGAAEQAHGTVAQAEANRTLAQAKVQAAQAQVQQAQAALQEAQTYAGYTKLYAPTDGVIKTRAIRAGELVSAGSTIYTLETTSQRWAKFYMTETALDGLRVGDRVTVKLLSDDRTYKGKVKVIDAAADFAIQKPSQSSGDTDIRSFGVKVLLTGLPSAVPTGSTVLYTGKGAQ
ncbi:HlyD family secretion protein [Paenibacillus campi]|uniref:HlyD family secretion protein n=1 Tax=Paenibacillus campi TaxID=3106031 RepID=UPI002AFE3C98|nr:biotin/lipoyl-binding protein [Paenibacillus sp. SGZ-1014]